MRTELTRRCWPPIELLPDIVLPPDALPDVLPLAVLPDVPLVLPEPLAPPDMLESTVPVTSTLWPTCFCRSLSCPINV